MARRRQSQLLHCGVEEGQGELFKKCPQCIENMFLPAKFCSNECFHSSWKQHKAWHEIQQTLLSDIAQLVTSEGLPQTSLEVLAERSEYDAHLTQASSRIYAIDMVGAKKILRKAVKLDPNRPEAYYLLAVSLETSGLSKQAAFYYALSIERWALVALTGRSGGVEVEDKWALTQWSESIVSVTDIYWRTRCVDHPLPEWYKVDGQLQIILKTAFKSCNSENSPKMKPRLSLSRANAIAGAIRDGKVHQEGASLIDLTITELLEAASCFRSVIAALQAGTDDFDLGEEGIATMNENIQMCTNVVTMKMMEEVSQMSASRESKPPSVPPVGSWVAFRSDERNALPDDTLEKEFGQVVGGPNSEGKVPVKVQGTNSDQQVLISPVNLVGSPQNEQTNALVACLEREMQWKFMATTIEGLKERGSLKSSRR